MNAFCMVLFGCAAIASLTGNWWIAISAASCAMCLWDDDNKGIDGELDMDCE